MKISHTYVLNYKLKACIAQAQIFKVPSGVKFKENESNCGQIHQKNCLMKLKSAGFDHCCRRNEFKSTLLMMVEIYGFNNQLDTNSWK